MGDPLLERFRQRSAAAGADVQVVGDSAGVVGLARTLADGGDVAVSPQLAACRPDVVTGLGTEALTDPTPARLADVAVGLAIGLRGVSETGSVLVDEHGIGDRSVSMLSRTLVYAIPGDALVASLDDVAEWLGSNGLGNGYRALITGPSRSADIERSLTIGVQGPSAMTIALVSDWTIRETLS